jgi:hypothetical protein
MLRGSIDSVHHERVGGWIHSDKANLREATVLAFVDDRCVGAGQVGVFRQDLRDANVGDGYSGFSFPISLAEPADADRLYVKLEGSDAILIPRNAKIEVPDKSTMFGSFLHDDSSVEWMRSRGWLDNEEYNFLKYMTQMGVYDLSLIAPRSQEQPAPAVSEYEAAGQTLLSLLTLSPAGTETLTCSVKRPEELIKQITLRSYKALPVVALYTAQPNTVAVVEGSHKDLSNTSIDGAISYNTGPDRLLFLNLLCAFEFSENFGRETLTVIFTRCRA